MRIIGGSWRGRRLLTPTGNRVRPTAGRTREALFNILAHAPFDQASLAGALWVDLFCGAGAVGLEALSRGAEACVFVDLDLSLARANATALGIDPVMLQTDATRLPGRMLPRPVDFAFLDPPYGRNRPTPTLLALEAGDWLAPGGIAIVESAADEILDLPATFYLHDARTYGAAKLWFASLRQNARGKGKINGIR